MDNDVARISTLCNRAISINAIKSENQSFFTTNFFLVIAMLTFSARINISAYSNMVTNLEVADTGTNFLYNSSNLMSVSE